MITTPKRRRGIVHLPPGVTSTPLRITAAAPRGLDPDDPWITLYERLADEAERRGEHDKAAQYRATIGKKERP